MVVSAKMPSRILFLALVLAAACFSLGAADASEPTPELTLEPTPELTPEKNIVELGVADKDFTILVKLVETAGLVDALSDEKATLTVFAPSNSAFKRLAWDLGFKGNFDDEDAVLSFLSAAIEKFAKASKVTPVELLQNILKYHVAPKVIPSKKLITMFKIRTLLPGAVIRRKRWMPLMLIDEAPALINPRLIPGSVDIEATNGIVHVINRVLIPADIKPVRRYRRYRYRHRH